ncbi:MAG: penicillin-binding protein activator [Gallionella sp.]|nr:penicillin-binding protein activator [Gallionella sp.]MDH4286633.1 penicillin-binding protein activator [Gallionella sp.]
MQRVLPTFLIWFSTLFVLYACTTPAPQAPAEEKPAALAAPVEIPVPASAVGETPAPVAAPAETLPPALPVAKDAAPHIALLLPIQSKDYGSAADAVQQGFMAAFNREKRSLPIRVYSDFEENINVVAVYRQAIANGALAVVGPLTRSGVSALAAEQNIPVPTLTLNIVEGLPAQQLFYFGMPVEAEARQAAQLASKQGLHQAIIITSRAQWSKRLQAAFEEAWFATGGGILREIEYNNTPGELADITELPGTAIFLAADAKTARLIRPYLPNRLPIYATSQIFSGNDNTLTNYDLNGIHFVDMPWLLQPDHPAVMTYPRATPPLSIDRERLYALGIDAYRLTRLLLSKKPNSTLPLDGVTGDIHLRDHIYQRAAIPAVFQEGRAQLTSAHAAPVIQMFPNQGNATP